MDWLDLRNIHRTAAERVSSWQREPRGKKNMISDITAMLLSSISSFSLDPHPAAVLVLPYWCPQLRTECEIANWSSKNQKAPWLVERVREVWLSVPKYTSSWSFRLFCLGYVPDNGQKSLSPVPPVGKQCAFFPNQNPLLKSPCIMFYEAT